MIENQIEKEINRAVYECFNENFSCVVHSSGLEDVDYQCDDSFSLAKILKTSPIVLANKICEKLGENEMFEKVFCKNGFINFVLSNNFVQNELKKLSTDEFFGVERPQNQMLFFLDYGGPNIAKPLHVGHLRSPIIGESIKRIIKFAGHKTLCDVHFGDFGLQIGEVIFGLREKNVAKENITLQLLEEIYPNISSRIKNGDEELNKTCAQITKELQNGNEEYLEYFKIIREISAGDIKRLFDYLDVHFDLYEGESNAYEYIPQLTTLLTQQNLLVESEGAKVIDISREDDKKQLPPLIFQKSNGAYLYGTTDMATVLERKIKFSPNKIIYVADIRQQLHFTQFFRACDKAKIFDEKNLEFYGFGTVNGTDGKPYKTREGKSPKLESLFEEVKQNLLENKEMNLEKEEDIDAIVNSVIKFADLQNNYEKDYIFDINKFSKCEGKTGPYILYSYVRLKKVYNSFKNDIEPKFSMFCLNKAERDVEIKLLNFSSCFAKAFENRKPNIIADYLFDLCLKLNAFYETNRFNSEENKEFISSWLKLIEISLNVVEKCLNLLAIKTIDKM